MDYNIFNTWDKDIFLYPGDIYIVKSSRRVVTLLGTCISVILYSELDKKSAIFHAMLPQVKEQYRYDHKASSKYVDYAFYFILNSLIRGSVKKSNLTAKLFGGACQLKGCTGNHIGEQNVSIARALLYKENIKLVAEDVGGKIARKIIFYPETGDTFMKYIKGNLTTLEKEVKTLRRIYEQN